MIHFFLLLFQHPRKIIANITSLGWYYTSIQKFKKQIHNNPDFSGFTLYPCLSDRFENSGTASGHYFHQDLYVAQKIFKSQPKNHVDVGSSIHGFVAHVASFREIEVIDIRPLTNSLLNIRFRQLDFMSDNPGIRDYCDSLSCLHALEHFGLGRYGDPIDSDGHVKGFNNLYRILKPDGILYFSVPMGKQRIEFNAHRVFDMTYLLNWFKDKFEVISFSFIDDKGDFHREVPLNDSGIKSNYNCRLGCAVFVLKKIKHDHV